MGANSRNAPAMTVTSPETVGTAPFLYRPIPHWPKLPNGWELLDVPGVAVDSHDRLIAFTRSPHPVIIFDPDGNVENWWGADMFVHPHGLQIAPDDTLYLTDDMGHAVYHCTADGEIIRTFGTPGQPSDTGIDGIDFRTIKCGAAPFNGPTNVSLDDDGRIFVSDGYWNARIHRYAADGTHELSWGGPGDGPSEFNVPHAVVIDPRGRVLLADRENNRIQVFSADGDLLTTWPDKPRPNHMVIDAHENLYVAENGHRSGLYAWQPKQLDKPGGRVSIYDLDNNLLARWGGGDAPCAPHDFYAPHAISLDSRGDMYVGEVTWSAGGSEGDVAADCPPLKKFARV